MTFLIQHIRLFKNSTKSDQMLNEIKNGLAIAYPRFRVLFPTTWTVRLEALKSVLDNWIYLESL